jgi:hypothetical protein
MARPACLLLLLFVFVAPNVPSARVSEAPEPNLTRREIRALPIHERPNRFGHFYGNTVRRRSAR